MAINSVTTILSDALAPFTMTRFEAEQPNCIALFAVGRGGNPARHHHLLQTLANRRCTAIAPHFDMLASTVPTKAELDMRIRRLEACIDSCAHGKLPIVGIGHSIGATALLALQGAEGETLDGQQLITGSMPRLERLALLAEMLAIRLPKVLAALASGAMLAVAGSILHRLIGNEMSSPEVLGISAGATSASPSAFFAIAPGLFGQFTFAVTGSIAVLAIFFLNPGGPAFHRSAFYLPASR